MSSILDRIRDLAGLSQGGEGRTGLDAQTDYVCHCKRVEYRTVDKAIKRGARSIADLQRRTTACTRCFGCRFELESMLEARLGDKYRRETTISLPKDFSKARVPQPMYMPVLAGFRGYDVDTRVIVFNIELEGGQGAVDFRADLMTLAGERVDVIQHTVEEGHSAVLDLSREAVGHKLSDGVGLIKLVLEAEEVGSLRPYFQWVTPTSIGTTHEKKAPSKPEKQQGRSYHWIFPIGRTSTPEEAYLFCTNIQITPMLGQRFIWQTDDGVTETAPLPELEFNQSAMVPLHEHFPTLYEGKVAGTVRLDPATHVVAGFMVRHDVQRQLWRVQHL
jgi:bacterioferritin-associated ferredoxin